MIDAFNQFFEWLGNGLYDMIAAALAYLVEWLTIAAINTKLFALKLSWDIAKNIMVNLGLSSMINTAWSSLDSRTLGYATFFRLPEAVTIILQAYIAKFSMSMLRL